MIAFKVLDDNLLDRILCLWLVKLTNRAKITPYHIYTGYRSMAEAIQL